MPSWEAPQKPLMKKSTSGPPSRGVLELCGQLGIFIKLVKNEVEQTKVAIRNIRRDFIEIKKREKKDSQLSEDELKKFLNEVQIYTDKYILNIDKILEQKKSDIMKV